jgi:hypothetical protein
MDTGLTEFKGRVNNCDSIARLMAMDDEGNVYGSYAPYRVFKYDLAKEKLLDLHVIIPHLDGPWNDRGHFHRENVWRNIIWHPEERVFYGIEHGTATLFRFNPRTEEMTNLGQFVIDELQGQRFVPFTPHSFVLHPDGHLYFGATGKTRLRPNHLLRYNISTGLITDLGIMVGDNGSSPLDIGAATVGMDGTIYFSGRISAPQGFKIAEGDRLLGFVVVSPEIFVKLQGEANNE